MTDKEAATTLEDIDDKDLLRGALYSSVRLAITRHNIELEPDTATEEEVAEDAAGACFGEECCQDIPIPEVTELLRRLSRAKSQDAGWNEREWQVAQQLADKADISVQAVFRQGLRIYQLIQVGTHKLVEVNPELKLGRQP